MDLFVFGGFKGVMENMLSQKKVIFFKKAKTLFGEFIGIQLEPFLLLLVMMAQFGCGNLIFMENGHV
jgi:hypothetical protein